MFLLVTERGKYLRIRKNVKKDQIIRLFSVPVTGEAYCGKIILLTEPKRFIYANAGASYKSIAQKEGVDEEQLKRLNGGEVIYPTKRVWLP